MSFNARAMMRFSALNSDDSSSHDSEDASPVITREAQEEEASELYRKALSSLQAEKYEEAREIFRELLALPFVGDCKPEDVDTSRVPMPPGLLLKYVALKNLGSIEVRLNRIREGVQAYLDAVEIDSSDVTVWHKIGTLALTLYLYPLARVAFEEGLQCSPQHWPCLSNLMTVTYVLNDYPACLRYASKALKLEPRYTKALVLRDEIFKQQPQLRVECNATFKRSDCSGRQEYSKEDAEAVLEEATALRDRRREQYALKKLSVVPFCSKMVECTWKALGEAIVKQYQHLCSMGADGEATLASPVDVTTVVLSSEGEENGEKEGDSSQPTSGNSTGDLVINTDPPSDPTSQGESDAVPAVDERPMQDFPVPEEGTGVRRGGKRRKLSLEYLDPSLKRRSARVRNTQRKTQESVNFQELLLPFLPSSLQNDDREDSNPTPTDLSSDHTYGLAPDGSRRGDAEKTTSSRSLEETESLDVKKFVERQGRRRLLMDVMYDYLHELSSREDLLWPEKLQDIYVAIYNDLRPHVERPSIFAEEDEAEAILRHSLSTLLYCEFTLDKLAEAKGRSAALSLSPRSPGSNHLAPDFPTAEFQSDLEFLRQMSVRWTVFEDLWSSVVLRSAWAEARFATLAGEVESAVKILEDMLDRIEQDSAGGELRLTIANCKSNNLITKELVQEQLESLQRCQSLEEVHRLYELGRFQSVADLLVQTFRKPAARGRRVQAKANIPERHAQLVLLQESLWNLKDFSGCLYWGEASLNEALHEYLSAGSEAAKQDWSNTIVIILSDVHRCIRQDLSLLGSLDSGKLARMAHNAIKLINVQMEAGDVGSDMPVPTVLPWNLLYYILKHEEDKICALAEDKDCVTPTGVVPSSLMLLFTAHEYLGRKSWCTSSDGVLLFLCIEVMTEEARKPGSHSDIVVGLEQCFYCLYGHPARRGKAKHLQEHNAPQVALTWERAPQVFDFYKPAVVPEFDGYKTSTVSSELEILLRRIAALVPQNLDPTRAAEAVTAYVEGASDEFPSLPPEGNTFHPVVSLLYYLLGDYYFKSKEFGKAIRYYTLDATLNPWRVDSWAGLALSRGSQLEQRINSCEPKSEGTITRRAISSLRCFKRALQLDPSNAALWIEYGSVAYMLQSHTSRQLKRSRQLGLSEEALEALSRKKGEYLELAKTCYEAANRCEAEGTGNDEMWLNHYLLGKIAHKMGEPPAVYLDHLHLSLQYLHRMNARYPKKILYHSPPPLSIEALELYYKIHALCFKFLLKYEDRPAPKKDLQAVRKHLEKAAKSPFATFREKAPGSASENEDPAMLPLTKRRAKKRASTADHDYLEGGGGARTFHHPSGQRPSVERELEEVVVVREILDSLITVVSEKLQAEERRQHQPVTTIVLGDPSVGKKPTNSGNVVCIDLTVEESRAELQRLIEESRTSVITHSAKATGSKNPDLLEYDLKQALLKTCVRAMRDCLNRFPQHFKSVYYLARFHCHSKHARDLQLSYDYLMHSGQSKSSDVSTFPGLFAERRNTNFFTGIWHTPGDEIDRPGSFATHMRRSVALLLEVLRHRRDVDKTVYLTVQLSRNPDLDKKYLRDTDRVYLAKKAFKQAVGMAQKKLNDLMNQEPPPEDSVLVSALLDVYKAWQAFQKAGVFVEEAGEVLSEAYETFKLGEVDSSPPILEQALAFCSRHLAREALSRSQESSTTREWMAAENFGTFGSFG